MIVIRLPSHFPVRATEWMLACVMASWGMVLILVPDIFLNPMMGGLRATAIQSAWGAIALGGGIAHFAALWINGTWRKSPHVRALFSGIGVLFWFQVCVGFSHTPTINTGWAVYPWLTVFSIYNVVRAMQDARLSDDHARGGIVGGAP